MHPTSKAEWILERQKKWANQIPAASKDTKSTQEMAVRNPNPYASQPLCHHLTTRNLVPHKWQLHHHVARNRSWDALTNQSARHPCQCLMKPDLGELSLSWHTWRTTKNWTANSRFTNIESRRQIPRTRTRLGTTSLNILYIYLELSKPG